MSDGRPVGIFDSGVGGLTVAKQIRKLLPGEDIVYFGDTARVPYGTKSKETVTRFSVENVEFLMEKDVKLVVVACNTASSLGLDFLKRCFRVPIIGVIEPGARAAAAATRTKRVGVMGTNATISSGAYERAIRKIGPKISVVVRGCPLFVPLVEEGWLNKPVTRQVASEYLVPLKAARIDTLVMGCTHYPLLKEVIQGVMGPGVTLVDSAKEVAKEARNILDAAGLLNAPGRKGKDFFYVSDEPSRFIRMAERFLGKKIKCARRPV
ncbi:MAG: glutamate racemase [Candidatus Omnitrophica bacterium]|nr:glutamate racemase [Candidatus Omnitrophota bacterium]